jgi:hypothetical protein
MLEVGRRLLNQNRSIYLSIFIISS